MKNMLSTLAATCLIILIISMPLVAQRANTEPRLSPNAVVSQTIGTSIVTIEYGRPGVKGRTIWGELVPYNTVWRVGANEATNIQFSNAVIINDHKIPAGKYSLFMIPTEANWTVIINSVAKQWGAYKYDKTKDILRFEATPLESTHTEWLEYSFDDLTPESATINLNWEKLEISIPIKIAE